MTEAATDLRVQVSHTLPFPPDRVFDAWLDPKLLAKFMVPAEGMTVPKAQTDPREGGQFTIVMQIPDGTEIPHTGTYMTIARPDQLVFTWDSPFSAEGSTVTLDFEAAGAGTKITLTHVKFPDAESRDNHSGGWSSILTALGNTLS